MSSQASSWQKTLEFIREDNSRRENPFTWLEAYWSGYEEGFNAAQRGFMTPQEFTPAGFHQFVSEHFGRRWPNAKGWRILIREHSGSEKEAFDLFFKLRFDYEKRQIPAA